MNTLIKAQLIKTPKAIKMNCSLYTRQKNGGNFANIKKENHVNPNKRGVTLEILTSAGLRPGHRL